MLDSLRHKVLGMPHGATHHEWENWRREAKANHRTAYWMFETAPNWLEDHLWHPPRRAWWWVRNRIYPRYWPVIRTGLEPGWHDADQMILHGCMAMLVRFIEDEHGGTEEALRWLRELEGRSANEFVPPDQIRTLREAIEIYHWWKRYPGEPESSLNVLDSSQWHTLPADERKKVVSSYWEEVAANSAKEDGMLKRLIDVRRGMWT